MVVKNGVIIPFVMINRIRIKICVAVVLASWSLPWDNQEWSCDIGMGNGFNMLKCSSATTSIEMDLQPDNYCEWTYSLSTWHLFS